VSQVAPTLDAELFINSFTALWAVRCAEEIEGAAFLTGRKPAPEQFEELTWALAERGRAISGAAYLLAVNALQRMARQVARFLLNFDVLLTPTLAEPPLPLGSFEPRWGNPLYGLSEPRHSYRSHPYAMQPANPRCPCRCPGIEKACRSAHTLWGDSVKNPHFFGWLDNSSPRAHGRPGDRQYKRRSSSFKKTMAGSLPLEKED